MRKLLLAGAIAALFVVPLSASAAPPLKPTTTTGATTTTTAPPAGITGYEIVRATTAGQIPPDGIDQVQPACPAGKVVTGGGWEFSSTPFGENMRALQNRPYFDGAVYSWLLVVKNENTVAVGAAAYAICADGA